ncbi:MAG TPA: MFS transporter [Ktedonobacteraceae bacterium]|nr:MFS transporter [Ktedonobacteraceae bacterium]
MQETHHRESANNKILAGPQSGKAVRHSLLILFILCCAQFTVALDLSIVNVALPSIQHDLGFSTQNLQWVVSAYSLMFGGLLLLGGKVGDMFGRRPFFLSGALIFALASLLGGFAPSQIWLIGTRTLQGVGAAFLSPNALALITTTFEEGPSRNKALGIVGTVMSSGVVMGNIFGGLLTAGPGWRWVFFINVPILIGMSLFALMILPSTARQTRRRSVDVPGALTITISLVTFVFVLTEGRTIGWMSIQLLGLLALALMLLIAFVLIELRMKEPLLRFALFRLRPLAAANLISLLAPGTYGAMLFFLTLYMQEVLQYSALRTGVALIPLEFALGLMVNLVPRLITRVGVKSVLMVAMIVMIGGLLLLLRITPEENYPATVLPALIVVGLGIGALFNAIGIAATSGVPHEEQGVAVGLMSTTQQLGNGLVLAIMVSISQAYTASVGAQGSEMNNIALVEGFHIAFLTAAGVMVIALLTTFLVIGQRDRTTIVP